MNKEIVIKIDETTKNPELATTADGMVVRAKIEGIEL